MTACTVARGTIYAGSAVGNVIGHSGPAATYTVGDTLDLSDDEIARLTALGVLADPAWQIVPIGDSGAFQIVPAA